MCWSRFSVWAVLSDGQVTDIQTLDEKDLPDVIALYVWDYKCEEDGFYYGGHIFISKQSLIHTLKMQEYYWQLVPKMIGDYATKTNADSYFLNDVIFPSQDSIRLFANGNIDKKSNQEDFIPAVPAAVRIREIFMNVRFNTFLPTIGQLATISKHIEEINLAIKMVWGNEYMLPVCDKLNDPGKKVLRGCWWSSTQYDNHYAWAVLNGVPIPLHKVLNKNLILPIYDLDPILFC